MKQSSLIGVAALMVLSLCAPPAFGQGVCDVKPFRLAKLKGRVMSDGPKGHEPLAGAQVGLWYVGDDVEKHLLVASTLSDGSGHFEVKGVREGLYRLEASKWGSGFIMNFAVVKVVKRAKKSDGKKQLTFVLGVDPLSPCGGGKVFLH